MARGALPAGDRSILHEFQMTEEEIARRKAFLELGDADIEALKGLDAFAQLHSDPAIEELYAHFLSFEDTRAFFRDPATLKRVKRLQKEYFLRLTGGEYGADYIANRINVGLVHQRIGLDLQWYLGAYNFYLRAMLRRLFDGNAHAPAKAISHFASLMKLVFLDISLAIQTYVRTIQRQQAAIYELSTPVLQVRPRLLMLPIVGIIDSRRAQQITEGLLRAIRANRAKVAVLDVTGVGVIDSVVANHLLQTVAAARLMGTTVIVTGLSSDIAQTLVGLGIDLGKLNTVGDLQGGIEEAERLLGYRLVATDGTPVAPAVPGPERRPNGDAAAPHS